MFSVMTKDQISWEFSLYDLRRLEKYSSLQADYLLVKDLVARLSRIYFVGRLNAALKITQSVSGVLLMSLIIMKSQLRFEELTDN